MDTLRRTANMIQELIYTENGRTETKININTHKAIKCIEIILTKQTKQCLLEIKALLIELLSL